MLLAPLTICCLLLPAATGASQTPQTVRVGLHDAQPVAFRDAQGQPSGFAIDIIDYIARQEGWRLQFVDGTWSECVQRLHDHDIDLLFPILHTPERDRRFDFSKESFFATWARVFARPDSGIESILDLDGKTLAVVREDIFNQEIRDLVDGFDLHCTFQELDTKTDVLQSVASANADVVVLEGVGGYWHIQEYGLVATPIVFKPALPHMAVPRGMGADLLRAIDRHLKELKDQPKSMYYQSYDAWFSPPGSAKIPGWMKWSATIGIALLAVFIVFSLILRHQVSQKTRVVRERNKALEKEIHERLQTEEALRRSETRLSLVTDSLPVLIGFLDTEERHRFCNATYAEWFGVSAHEVLGSTLKELIQEDSYQRARPFAKQALAGRTTRFESRWTVQPGQSRVVDVTFIPHLGPQNEVSGFYALVADLTDRKKAEVERTALEEQLRHSQRMESVGELASGVAHDFRNLLTVIAAHGERIRKDVRNHPQVLESLQAMASALRQANTVTRSLLTFSRKLATIRIPLDLAQTAKDASRLLQRTLPPSVELRVHTSDSPAPWIEADETQMQQVLINLALNARDAMPQGGVLQIQVDSPRANDCAQSPTNEGAHPPTVELRVRDNGMGMDAKVQARVFEPFFTTKQEGKGTGLGLSTVHSIVAEHHGEITVASQPGQGTTFTLRFPAVPPQTDREQAQPSSEARGSGQRILLAEDNQQIRQIVASTLTSAGFEVLQASGGDELLAVYEGHRDHIDLFLLDVDLPQRTGWEVLQQMRQSRRTPAILITASSDGLPLNQSDTQTVLLRKPFPMTQLMGVVHRMLKSDDRDAVEVSS
jgi:PAS domain S-box-containing protein